MYALCPRAVGHTYHIRQSPHARVTTITGQRAYISGKARMPRVTAITCIRVTAVLEYLESAKGCVAS